MKINWLDLNEPVEIRRSTSSNRPYPGVRLHKGMWEAIHQMNGRGIFLASCKTPEMARFIVLEAQARYLEAKAARYREEAMMVMES